MSVTDDLLRLDSSLRRHPEGDWQSITLKLPTYTSFNDAGVECEVGEFFYGLTRMMQPERILETGTHWGIATCYFAMGLKDNGKGVIDTIEFLPEIYEQAVLRFKTVGLSEYINSHLMDASLFKTEETYDIVLLDTEPQTRFGELLKYYSKVRNGGFIFIHDLHQHMGQVPNEEHGFAWPWGKLPENLEFLVRRGNLRPFHFRTPRGLTGFYKVEEKDYKWHE